MDRAESLAIFAEVAERGSFAEAARRRGRSPAAVTRDIAELERRLGVRRLNRTTRAVSLPRRDGGCCQAKLACSPISTEIEGRRRTGTRAARRVVAALILFGRLHVEPLVLEFLDRFP
jgi:DNA-binding transcriptional LysR family regulator